jgi:hypothetical protein
MCNTHSNSFTVTVTNIDTHGVANHLGPYYQPIVVALFNTHILPDPSSNG